MSRDSVSAPPSVWAQAAFSCGLTLARTCADISTPSFDRRRCALLNPGEPRNFWLQLEHWFKQVSQFFYALESCSALEHQQGRSFS